MGVHIILSHSNKISIYHMTQSLEGLLPKSKNQHKLRVSLKVQAQTNLKQMEAQTIYF